DGVKANLSRSIMTSNLFEIGPVFYGNKPTEQNTSVAGIRQGLSGVKDWANSAKLPSFYDVKNDVFAVLSVFGVNASSVKFETKDLPSWLNPYKSASIIFANKIIGYVGEIHPLTLKKFGIKNANVVAFEINLDLMPESKSKGTAKKKLTISDFLPINRDFAVIIDDTVPAGNILNAVKNSNKEYIKDAVIFDIYKGEKLDSDKKSVAVHITIEQKDKTLTEDEINVIFNSAINSVVKLGGILRDK
ncbi:MAG: phenylalanine--tRNA ligase subunit beta, partial [Alphaproteobacteria bacterium]|nr:phenylalanine--tRNA ligase subunit beta [Alphaproteobacteria bacterium]